MAHRLTSSTAKAQASYANCGNSSIPEALSRIIEGFEGLRRQPAEQLEAKQNLEEKVTAVAERALEMIREELPQ